MTKQKDMMDIQIHIGSFLIKNRFTPATGIADVIAARIIQPNVTKSQFI